MSWALLRLNPEKFVIRIGRNRRRKAIIVKHNGDLLEPTAERVRESAQRTWYESKRVPVLAHYSHARVETKRETLAPLSKKPQGVVRSQPASQKESSAPPALENLVGVAGIESATPCMHSA